MGLFRELTRQTEIFVADKLKYQTPIGGKQKQTSGMVDLAATTRIWPEDELVYGPFNKNRPASGTV